MADSPPLEDIPKETHEEVKSLLAEGMTIDPDERPSAATLLEHPAFNLSKLIGAIELYVSVPFF